MSQTVETKVLGVDLRSGVITVEYLTHVTTTITTTITITRTKTLTAVVATAITYIYTHPLTTVSTVISTNTTLTIITGGESVSTAPATVASSAPAQTFVPSASPIAQKSGEYKPQPVPITATAVRGGRSLEKLALYAT